MANTQKTEHIEVKLIKTDETYKKSMDIKQRGELGIGRYAIVLSVTALKEALHIPASVGTGRVSTGFVYVIEGTEKGKTASAEISCRGEGVATVTSGSISYWKIAPGKTAQIKLYIQIKGARIGTYQIVVNRINYKLNPSDMRYTRFLTDIRTGVLEFRK